MSAKQKLQAAEDLGVGGSQVAKVLAADDYTDNVYEVGEDETNIHCSVPASGTRTHRLPRLGNEKLIGRDYHFLCISDGGGTGCEVEDNDDAFISGLNYATASNGMTAQGDNVILRYLGTHYRQIAATLT